MALPDLDSLQFVDKNIKLHVVEGHSAQAVKDAARYVSLALCDMASAELACGEFETAVERLQTAISLHPQNRAAFHNLVTMLLKRRKLRGANLRSLAQFVGRQWSDIPWVREYRQLLYMPRFINLEFVGGKCNLKCRMCIGRNAAEYPDEFRFAGAASVSQLLDIAPTVGALTLSSGDSDPLLHPEFEEFVALARKHEVTFDIFTNGHALGARKCRSLVDSQVVQMLNISIDAVTPETYLRIRRASLDRLLPKIEMLQAMKRKEDVILPWLSLSFVAMEDNIAELPDFIDLAQRLDARRVLVEDLTGWDNNNGGNHLATDNPRCFEYVSEAWRRAAAADIKLVLPKRLKLDGPTDSPDSAHQMECADDGESLSPELTSATEQAEQSAAGGQLQYCGWLPGVWSRMNGKLDPCCLVQGVADMGNASEGPLIRNIKYARVKDLLLSGKVFRECAGQKMCPYVQQQHAAGIPLEFITREDLGELHPGYQQHRGLSGQPTRSATNSIALPVATRS